MTDDAGSAIDPAELALERRRWGELSDLMASLTPSQAMTAGYFEESWSAKDMLAHIGAWLAEAGAVLEQIRSGTFRADEIDIDAMNARFLADMADVPLEIVRIQATASRSRMLSAWASLPRRTTDADGWLRKAGAEHYDEHLPRLREWVVELRRSSTAR